MHLVANLLLIAAWVGTHVGAIAWVGAHYARGDRRLETLLAIAVVAMAWRRFGGPGVALRRLANPAAWAPLPLGLLAACVVLELALARWLDLHLLRASAFVIGSYALCGLYAGPVGWRGAMPWIGLLTLTLPFGAFSEVCLGFPARLFTADLVARGLDVLGVATLTQDTILVLDRPGGPAALHVDVPCAGVKSLWSAGVFLLASACVEGRRVDRWFAAAVVATTGALLVANTLRVGALVVIGEVLRAPGLASAVHVPLGLLGFAWAVGAGWWLLRQSEAATPLAAADAAPDPVARPGALAPALAVVVCLAAVVAPRNLAAPEPLLFTFGLPSTFDSEPIPPTVAELRFFSAAGTPPPQKWRWATGDLGGSVLVVPSREWRAHHQPEACLLGQGLAVEGPWTVPLSAEFPVRVASVDHGAATAVWWFQSPTRVTEDFAARTWAALSGREDRWVLVSLLVNGGINPSEPAVAALLRSLHDAVAVGLTLPLSLGRPPVVFPHQPPSQEVACAPAGPC